jgi:tungstate transport system substrate-binding protein
MFSSLGKIGVRRVLLVLALVVLAAAAMVGTSFADGNGRSAGKAAPDNATLLVSSTTSVRDSGLMTDVVLPAFNAAHPEITVKPSYVGSGQAIQAARDGNADVIIVHSPADELTLLASGDATMRLPFAYNYFTIVGPKGDPAKVSTAKSASAAFKRIAAYGAKLAAGKVAFVSRGDASGTNKKELQLWYAAKVTAAATAAPTGAWYITTGSGMGPTLQIAAEKTAYTLTDTATWLKMKSTLKPLVKSLTKKEDLKNQYSVLLLNQAKHDRVASAGAEWLAAYLVSYEGQKAIGAYGKATYGEPLFFPNAFTISAKTP